MRLAYEIASHQLVFALLLGAVDLSAELGFEPRPDAVELHYARSKLVVDSGAAGLRRPFDAVSLYTRDLYKVAAEARLARSVGFGGKACIHPAQVPVVNRAFSRSASEVQWARRVIAAGEAAELDGRGAVAVAVDGMMVDAPVLARARHILSKSAGRTAT